MKIEGDEYLQDRDRERIRRQERRAEDEGRALMNSGGGKWFKQVLDHQAAIAHGPAPKRRRHGGQRPK